MFVVIRSQSTCQTTDEHRWASSNRQRCPSDTVLLDERKVILISLTSVDVDTISVVDLDQIYDEINNPKPNMKKAKKKFDPDLPGFGKFYCQPCE